MRSLVIIFALFLLIGCDESHPKPDQTGPSHIGTTEPSTPCVILDDESIDEYNKRCQGRPGWSKITEPTCEGEYKEQGQIIDCSGSARPDPSDTKDYSQCTIGPNGSIGPECPYYEE
jgi:hypothetical protein